MMTWNATAVFCEDIREEKQELFSVMGVMSDVIEVSMVPGQLPKLGFYIRLQADIEAPLNELKVHIRELSGALVELSSWSPDVVDQARSSAREHGLPYMSLHIRGAAAPFIISSVGRTDLLVTLDGEQRIVGTLTVLDGAHKPAT